MENCFYYSIVQKTCIIDLKVYFSMKYSAHYYNS